MSNLKVLNVITMLDPSMGGGSIERTFQMSRFLSKIGVKCTVLTSDIGLTPERVNDLKGVDIVAFPSLNRRFYIPNFSYSRIKKIVKSVDIIHLMNNWTLLNAVVYFIARRLRKPYVVCPAGSLPIYRRSRIFKRLYNWIVGKRIVRNADRCIAISVNEIPQFRDYGVNINKICVIPNGINRESFQESSDFDFKKKYGLTNCHIILFIGRLNHIKGPDILLRAFCNVKDKLQNYHLVFVGPDEGMLPELKNIAAEFDVEKKVHFLGYLGGIDKVMAYYSSELLVIPSRLEAMSIVVLEAGITGTPVVITESCGFNNVAASGGGLVVPASVEGVQKGMEEVLGDPAELKSRGEKLKNYICDHFNWDIISGKHLKLYNEILEECRQKDETLWSNF